MNAKPLRIARYEHSPDARVGDDVIEVKFGVDAVRTLRTSMMQIAYDIAGIPSAHGYIVLADSPITRERLQSEWERAVTVLQPDLLQRLTICLFSEERIIGIPHDPDAQTSQTITKVVQVERGTTRNTARIDYTFVVQKILLHRLLTSGEPVTSEWIARTAGCSYPAVARALGSLGSLLERCSDRRVVLRWFPREEFARLTAIATRARFTARFVDHSGQPRSPESHLRRLEKLNPPGIALGGVLGARHYFPDINLVGTPRLDLSLHSPGRRMDLQFLKQLDPALKRVMDPLAPANVVIHAVNHADSLFTRRDGGLAWADPVECLFDLTEARLDAQASQFLTQLETQAKTTVRKALDGN
ncbi:MAG TPA: hypothetical protein VGN23_00760 [Verrucomicrobiae bacterium]|jgi:hypothetical protein